MNLKYMLVYLHGSNAVVLEFEFVTLGKGDEAKLIHGNYASVVVIDIMGHGHCPGSLLFVRCCPRRDVFLIRGHNRIVNIPVQQILGECVNFTHVRANTKYSGLTTKCSIYYMVGLTKIERLSQMPTSTDFLVSHCKENTPVTVFLTNGVKLGGSITDVEAVQEDGKITVESINLTRDGITQLIFRQAIATVMPAKAFL